MLAAVARATAQRRRAGAGELLGDHAADRRAAPQRRARGGGAVRASWSTARAAAARNWSRAPSIAAAPRRHKPFCTLNCAALPDDLVEAELFGHARGAFTGAIAERAGVFEEAHGGTLFLDEIGELTPRAQAKVLRVIQEGELRRVGENVSRRVDVRIVSATNRALRQEVDAGRFRLDLLYRLDVIHITVPPLRERREDIARARRALLARRDRARRQPRGARRADARGAGALRLARQRARAAERARRARRPHARSAASCRRVGAAARFARPARRTRLDARRGAAHVRASASCAPRWCGPAVIAAARPPSSASRRQGLTKLMSRLGIKD